MGEYHKSRKGFEIIQVEVSDMPRQPKQRVWLGWVSWVKEQPVVFREKLNQYFDLDTTDVRLFSELKIWKKK
jgi:hypothetical protein